METTQDLIQTISSALSGFSIVIGIVMLIYNRKKVWRSKLTEKQLEYLIELYDDLCYLNVESLNAKYWAKNYHTLRKGISDFERDQPESYKSYLKQKQIYLKYRLQNQYGNYLFFPNKSLENEFRNYFELNGNNFVPTFFQLSTVNEDEFNTFNSSTIKLIDEISKTIKDM